MTLQASCDVLFFPYQYAGISYSVELICSSEKVNTAKSTTILWGGIGCAGSFLFIDEPVAGLELAIEKRHYFKSDKFKHFSVSGYIGGAFMTNLDYINETIKFITRQMICRMNREVYIYHIQLKEK